MRRCDKCEFGYHERNKDYVALRGQWDCRKWCPVMINTSGDGDTAWPNVALDDWCGEFAPKQLKPEQSTQTIDIGLTEEKDYDQEKDNQS